MKLRYFSGDFWGVKMKKGDTVRIIDVEHEGFGEVGEIKSIPNLMGGFEIKLPKGFLAFVEESQLELVEELPTKPKIELTIKNTVFINGVEMQKWELVDLRNKLSDIIQKLTNENE